MSAHAPEYKIYSFHKLCDKTGATPKWALQKITDCKDEALRTAADLFESQRFHRIEVKQNIFDEKKNRLVDLTLKTYAHTSKSDGGLTFIYIAAGFLGVAVIALTQLL